MANREKLTYEPLSFLGEKEKRLRVPSPEGRGWAASGAFSSRRGPGEGSPILPHSASSEGYGMGRYYRHNDVLPVIARIIDEVSRGSIGYVKHDKIASSMLEEPGLQLFSTGGQSTRRGIRGPVIWFYGSVKRSQWDSRNGATISTGSR